MVRKISNRRCLRLCENENRMDGLNSVPILDYPRELYAGALHYRSPGPVIAFVALAVFGGVFFWVSAQAGASAFALLAFKISGVLCWLAAGWGGVLIATDSRHVFTFTTAGVQIQRKFVPWSDVCRIASNGKPGQPVKLFITVQKGGGNLDFKINYALSTSYPINESDYEKLVQLLKNELSASYPDLKIGGYFAVET
jgi:hypothetical protein